MLLEVEGVDGLIALANETPGEWTTLAGLVKERLAEAPF